MKVLLKKISEIQKAPVEKFIDIPNIQPEVFIPSFRTDQDDNQSLYSEFNLAKEFDPTFNSKDVYLMIDDIQKELTTIHDGNEALIRQPNRLKKII